MSAFIDSAMRFVTKSAEITRTFTICPALTGLIWIFDVPIRQLRNVHQPVISQRVVQQVIQLKDGEPSILAGLLQQNDTKSVSGTPGLGEIPFLKYFFSSQDKVQQSDEIVFLLIPHIVRESLLSDSNTRVIDSGTSQSIELRRRNPNDKIATDDDLGDDGATVEAVTGQPTSAANAASAM